VTAQISDCVILGGTEFAVAGVSGEGLFDPQANGLAPSMINTACWRGYVCWYAVGDDRLILDQLVLGGETTLDGEAIEPGASVLGQPAHPSQDGFFAGCLQLRRLRMPVPFSGGLLLGEGFVSSTYVHMGFHPAWRYESVVELLAHEGRVTEIADRSAEMAAIRRRIAEGDQADPDGERGGPVWIERTFTLDYTRSGLG
jgi:hypothetical protein